MIAAIVMIFKENQNVSYLDHANSLRRAGRIVEKVLEDNLPAKSDLKHLFIVLDMAGKQLMRSAKKLDPYR